ncbi:MAG: methyltransferase domain-containing protein, partial [Desulfobacterales bacterium]|nr:methyltransferase domain-containing protein [Desulfobacterales bacterium]
MQKFIIDDLCCPAMLDDRPCRSRLLLNTATATTTCSGKDENELVEGLLTCRDCGQTYPILGGLPILVADPWQYVLDRKGLIFDLVSDSKIPISRSMEELVHLKKPDTKPATLGIEKYENPTILNEYLAAHYDDFSKALPKDHPLHFIIRDYYRSDFYSTAFEMLKPYLSSTVVALDLGCSVGRGAYEMAGHCKLVYGIELSYNLAFAARRVLRHFPSQLSDYPLKFDGDITQNRLLPNLRKDNVEIIVASADNLPFPTARFGATNSWNLIDRLSAPEKMLAEQERVLSPNGILSLTSPYNWETCQTPRENWIGGTIESPTVNVIRERLLLNLEILDEKAYMPWIFWIFERYFELFFT